MARLSVLFGLALGLAWPAGWVLAQTAAATPAPADSTSKPLITKAADLPRFSYPVSGKLEAMVRNS